MNEESKDIKIPIKAIVEQAMYSNGAKYEEDEFNLLRRYFIACLNLGYMLPTDLTKMVNKFASKIKIIVLNYNNVNKMDYYVINGSILYINGQLKSDNITFYEINFFKAVSEVLFETNDNNISLSNALCEIAAEKIYNMDVNGSRIIMPHTTTETILNDQIQIRAGYLNYNLIISLLKQLFMSKKINENRVIHDMYFEGYNKFVSNLLLDSNTKLLVEVLDSICAMYISRKVKNHPNAQEKLLIDKYQILINDSFSTIDQNYYAFCALITSDSLREKCMKKFNLE